MASPVRPSTPPIQGTVHSPKPSPGSPNRRKRSAVVMEGAPLPSARSVFASLSPERAAKQQRPLHEMLRPWTPISDLYGRDFDNPNPTENKLQFHQLREQIELIEERVEDLENEGKNVTTIRKKVLDIYCSGVEFERKMAELGALYYFIREGEIFGDEDSYLQLFVDAMTADLKTFEKPFENLPPNVKEQISTGIPFYILSHLPRLILPNHGEFNLGGVYAAKFLLNTSLGVYLAHDHREQVLGILENMVKDPRFRTLFQQNVQIDPEMEIFVRIDLKFFPNAPISRNVIFWAAMQALFFPLRQDDHEGNCYAVSLLINLICNFPYQAMRNFLDVLKEKEATFFAANLRLPLLPLFKHHFRPKTDCKLNTHGHDVVLADIVPIRSALLVAGVKDLVAFEEPVPGVFSVMEDFLDEEAMRDDEIGVAHQTFHSFKQNTLQQVLIAKWQFADANNLNLTFPSSFFSNPQTATRSSRRKEEFAYERERFFHELEPEFDRVILNQSSLLFDNKRVPRFLKEVKELLRARIWLVDQINRVEIRDGNVYVAAPHKKRVFENFEGDRKAFCEALTNTRALAYIKDGQIVFLDDFANLAGAVKHCIKTVREEYKKDGKTELEVQRCANLLVSYLDSRAFEHFLAHFLANTPELAGKNVTWKDFFATRALLLSTCGGNALALVERLGYVPEGKFEIISSSVLWLFQALTKVVLAQEEKGRRCPYLLAETETHDFNILPKSLRSFGQHPALFDALVINPSRRLLSNPLTLGQLERLLNSLDNIIVVLSRLNLGGTITAADFLEVVHHVLSPERAKQFDVVFDIILRQRDVKTFLHECLPKLFELYIPPGEKREKIKAELENSFLDDALMLPAQFAHLVQEAFLKENIAVRFEDLERDIARIFDIPLVIPFGDLNWGELSEMPRKTFLCFRYNLAKNCLGMCKRVGAEEYELSSDSYEDILKELVVFFYRPSLEI